MCDAGRPEAVQLRDLGHAGSQGSIAASARLGAPAACPDREQAHEQLEQALSKHVNEARRRGAECAGKPFATAPPLELSQELECAAGAHASAMAQLGFFSHVDPEGSSSSQRAARQGFHGLVAENLAWGQAGAEQVVSAWLQSAGHCATLMSTTYSALGVGHAEGAHEKPLWVMMVGERNGARQSKLRHEERAE